MAATLPDNLRRVLDGPVFVTMTTVQPDGSPQSSPVWAKREGDDVLISTTTERRKTKNLERDPRISVVVQNPDEPYSYAEIRGTAELTTDRAQDLIDELSVKYVGKTYGEFNPAAEKDAPRVVVRVTPRKVVGQGNVV